MLWVQVPKSLSLGFRVRALGWGLGSRGWGLGFRVGTITMRAEILTHIVVLDFLYTHGMAYLHWT